MKRRELKKSVKFITDNVVVDCIAATLNGDEKQRQQATELLPTLLRIQSDFVSRFSHVEPGIKARDYFKNLKIGLVKELNLAAEHLDEE